MSREEAIRAIRGLMHAHGLGGDGPEDNAILELIAEVFKLPMEVLDFVPLEWRIAGAVGRPNDTIDSMAVEVSTTAGNLIRDASRDYGDIIRRTRVITTADR